MNLIILYCCFFVFINIHLYYHKLNNIICGGQKEKIEAFIAHAINF